MIERALRTMDQTRYKARLGIKEFDKIVRRKRTGVPGLDDLIEGGYPEGYLIVVTGPPGGGKTTLALQFLKEGTENGERCVLFSFEESASQLARQCLRFGWDMSAYMESGLLEVFGLSMLTLEEIYDIIETFKPKRVVLDSLNVLEPPDELRYESSWRALHKLLKRLDITSIVVTEKSSSLRDFSYDDYDFMGDGIIFLDRGLQYNGLEYMEMPLLSVLKMSSTDVKSVPHEFCFSRHGITLRCGTSPTLVSEAVETTEA